MNSLAKGVSLIKQRERKKRKRSMTFLWGLVHKESGSNDGFRLSSFCMQYRKMSRERKEHTFITFPFTFFALLPSFALITLLDFSNKSFFLLYPFSFLLYFPAFTFHIHLSLTHSST